MYGGVLCPQTVSKLCIGDIVNPYLVVLHMSPIEGDNVCGCGGGGVCVCVCVCVQGCLCRL